MKETENQTDIVARVLNEMGITEAGKPGDSWNQYFDSTNRAAVYDLGGNISFGLVKLGMPIEAEGSVSYEEMIRMKASDGIEKLNLAKEIVERVVDTIKKGEDVVLKFALTHAERGEIKTVNALLEGKETSDTARTMKAISLLQEIVNSTRDGESIDSRDTLSAAGVHLARLIAPDLK